MARPVNAEKFELFGGAASRPLSAGGCFFFDCGWQGERKLRRREDPDAPMDFEEKFELLDLAKTQMQNILNFFGL